MDIVTRDLPATMVERAYGRWASVYDALCGPLFAGAHRAAAEAANRIGGDILEVGVGTGLLLPLYRPDARITGIDLSPAMLDRAIQRVAERRMHNIIRLELADIGQFGREPCSYDVIVLPFVLTLLQAPEPALDNCLRLLRPGGEIVIVSHFRSHSPLLAALEEASAPLVRRFGLRPDFPVSRLGFWCAASGATILANEPVGSLGVYRRLRISRQ
jgi:phosphatidylethanolamine/phosphatidyl-N-methylethanolamine N-methyltransferase